MAPASTASSTTIMAKAGYILRWTDRPGTPANGSHPRGDRAPESVAPCPLLRNAARNHRHAYAPMFAPTIAADRWHLVNSGRVDRRLQDQSLQHRHQIERRAATLRAIAIAETLDQPAPEILEVHRRIENLKRVAVLAERFKMIGKTEKDCWNS